MQKENYQRELQNKDNKIQQLVKDLQIMVRVVKFDIFFTLLLIFFRKRDVPNQINIQAK